MNGLNVDICCLSETRLYDSSVISQLDTQSANRQTKYYLRCSGDPTASSSGVAGMGISLSQRAETALLEWIPINSRLCAMRFTGSCKVNQHRGKKRCLFVISAYAPTNCSHESVKDDFCAQLHDLLQRVPGTDIIVLAGDLNARVGRLASSECHLGGSHGLGGNRNDNGERLLSLC
jgi:hypothetical protein